MAEIDIPTAALQAYLAIDGDHDSDEDAMDAMRPIVAPVVAAEWRRIADQVLESGMGLDVRTREVRADIAMKLQGRANQLDGGA